MSRSMSGLYVNCNISFDVKSYIRVFLLLAICALSFALFSSQAAAANCTDGIFNGDEIGIDCGGSCSACTTLLTRDKEGKYVMFNQTFTGTTGFLLYLPPDYNSTKDYPVILSLHGAGTKKTGTKLDVPLIRKSGLPRMLYEGMDLPFIIIMPQGNEWDATSYPSVIKILDLVATNYSIDSSRIYVTGMSMGGRGTNNFLYNYPNIPAAAAPVAGYGNTNLECGTKHIPRWFFHNEIDPEVASSGSKNLYNKLKTCPGVVDARMTIYNKSGHDSWNDTYNLTGMFKSVMPGSRVYDEEIYLWFMRYNRTELSGVTCFSCIVDYDKDGYNMSNDCKDNNASINPGKPEICGNSVDENCDGSLSCTPAPVDADGDGRNSTIDCNDANASVWQMLTGYRDMDADSYTIGNLTSVCSGNALPAGYRTNSPGMDCNDNDALSWQIVQAYLDSDGDSYTVGSMQQFCTGGSIPSGYVAETPGEDCDDFDVNRWQAMVGYIDADFDGYTVGDAEEFCNDGILPQGYTIESYGIDCNDNDYSAWVEMNAYVDWDDDSYTDGTETVLCTDGSLPGGYDPYASSTVDCNDFDAFVWEPFPGYPDVDFDGHTASTPEYFCTELIPGGYSPVPLGSDCNDNDASVWNMLSGYADTDGDSYTIGALEQFCSGAGLPNGYRSTSSGTDCNDLDFGSWQTLSGYVDADSDTYTVGSMQQLCTGSSLPGGYSIISAGNDCNDANSDIRPGATDVCGNGIDEDCSGSDLACAPAPTCSDGSQNGNETGVDCGGPQCGTCAITAANALFSYSFNTSTVTDASGNGRTGVNSGATWSTQGGSGSGAFTFDGGDYIRVGSSTTLDGMAAITAEAWVSNSAMIGGYEYVVGKRKDNDVSWGLYSDPSANWFFFVNTATTGVSTPATAGSWQHVVGTWDGTTSKIYVNGILKATFAQSGSMNSFTSSNVLVGARETASGRSSLITGKIGEVHVYDFALTASQIGARYNATKSKYP